MKKALVMGFGLGLWVATGLGAPPAAPGKAPAAAEKKQGVIAGQIIQRKVGDGFLGLQVVDGNFKLTYYDKDKLPVAADHPRALLRWPVRYKVGDERVMLNQAGDGTFLTSARFIRPPYNFKLYITLLGASGDDESASTEAYVINFRQ